MDAVKIFEEAVREGLKAGERCEPQPIKVVGCFSAEESIIPDGVCGFAWVVVKCKGKGRTFIKGLKEAGLVIGNNDTTKHNRYFRKRIGYPGFTYWISDHNQSYEKKKAHMQAFVRTLKKYGIGCQGSSQLD